MWVNGLLRADSSSYAALTQAGNATLPGGDTAAARQAFTWVAAADGDAATAGMDAFTAQLARGKLSAPTDPRADRGPGPSAKP